jgi:hypothetical protein
VQLAHLATLGLRLAIDVALGLDFDAHCAGGGGSTNTALREL